MMQLGRTWVGLQTTRANALVALALKAGVPTELAGYREIRPEIPIEGGSRLDFRLRDHPQDPRTAYVEVKTVTMAEGATALFPDSVTTRGLRHLEALMDLHAKGHRAVMLFAVLRADCDGVEPADAIDPNYGAALRKAARSGVEILALGTRVTARAITIERMLPVRL
jgi:sugar fermentation stimulation protein A